MPAARSPLWLIVPILLHTGPRGWADETTEKKTHPFYDTNKVELQPAYTDVRDGGNSTQLLVRLALVNQYLLIPGLKVGNTFTFARLEMYAESLNLLTSPMVAGLQDWNALLLGVKPFRWGAQLGGGIYAVLPTATDAALGTQEFQLGPALGFMVTRVSHLQIGALVDFFFSVAGTTPDLALAQVQPNISYHLPRAFFFQTDGIMKFDFHKSPHATIPLNLQFGCGLTKRLVLAAIVEGVTTGTGAGNVSAKLNLTYLGW